MRAGPSRGSATSSPLCSCPRNTHMLRKHTRILSPTACTKHSAQRPPPSYGTPLPAVVSSSDYAMFPVETCLALAQGEEMEPEQEPKRHFWLCAYGKRVWGHLISSRGTYIKYLCLRCPLESGLGLWPSPVITSSNDIQCKTVCCICEHQAATKSPCLRTMLKYRSTGVRTPSLSSDCPAFSRVNEVMRLQHEPVSYEDHTTPDAKSVCQYPAFSGDDLSRALPRGARS